MDLVHELSHEKDEKSNHKHAKDRRDCIVCHDGLDDGGEKIGVLRVHEPEYNNTLKRLQAS